MVDFSVAVLALGLLSTVVEAWYTGPTMRRLLDHKGALAGDKLAANHGFKLGDTATLKGTIFPGQQARRQARCLAVLLSV